MPKTIVYGEGWKQVDDRRFTVRRVPADDPGSADALMSGAWAR